MRTYKNDFYENRGFSWQPPADSFSFPQDFSDDPPYPQGDGYCYPKPNPPCHKCPYCPKPYPPCPRPWPCPEPYCYRYPVPQPIPYPFPVPCNDKPHPEPKPPCPERFEAFGYFASITPGGAFAGGIIPLTFADPLNRNVVLNAPGNTQVLPHVSGLYRVVYSVTTTAASTGAFLQLLRNGQVVSTSPIPIQEGVNENEIFLFLNRNDTLSLNLTGPVTLANGKNASILVQLISRT